MSRQSPTEAVSRPYEYRNYDSHGSGVLRGGGGFTPRRRYRRSRRGVVRNIPQNVLLSDRDGIRELPPYDPRLEFDYTDRELLLYAEKILIEDSKPVKAYPQILLMTHLKARQKKEIYTANGTPDPSFVKGIYNRSHPNGRRIASEEQRRLNGASYYVS